MEEQTEEVLFEAWFFKLKAGSGQTRLRLSSAWVKRYCILRRIDDRAVLQYHKTKPDDLSENPKHRYELWPTYKTEKHRDLYGKPFVIQVTTSLTKFTLATEDESLFHLFAFFLQTQTQLLELHNNTSTFVVRPENSEEHQCLGSRGSMCILHITEWGVILAFELSRCVLAFWPLKSIKSYETSGKGQFGLEIGRNSATGPGNYVFNTRLSQDIAIYNMLDGYVNSAVELRQSSDTISDFTMSGEYKKLQEFTTAKSDSRFTSQLKRISRNIHDPLLQLIGGTSQRRQASNADLSGETTLTGRKTASERSNTSSSETPSPSRPPPFDFEAQNAKLHRTPPPAYHRYSNEEMLQNGAPKTSEKPMEDQYLLMKKSNQPEHSSAKRELSFDENQTIPKRHDNDETPTAGVTAALPSLSAVTTWPRLHRLASRSAEDLSERRAANVYAYNNNTFQAGEGSLSVYSEDGDSTGHIIYSYAIPAEVSSPTQLVRQRSGDASHSPTSGGRVRRSMSNPNILGSQLDQLVPADQYEEVRRPELPVRPSFLNIQKNTPAKDKSPSSIQGISLTPQTRSFRKIPNNNTPSPSPSDNPKATPVSKAFQDQSSPTTLPSITTVTIRPPMLTKLGPRVTNVPGFPAGRHESSHLFQFLQNNRLNPRLPHVFQPNNPTFGIAASNVPPASNVGNHITTISSQSAGSFSTSESFSWSTQFNQMPPNNISPSRDFNKNITVESKVPGPVDETMC